MTVEIPLTRARIAIIDDCDADLVAFKWRLAIARRNQYAVRTIDGRTEYLHQVVMGRILYRNLEATEDVDHINHLGVDNQRSNLRLATRSQNMANQRTRLNSSSGFKGVYRNYQTRATAQLWTASITVNGTTINLGGFPTKIDAARAYNQAATKYFGEYAYLNVIPDEVEA